MTVIYYKICGQLKTLVFLISLNFNFIILITILQIIIIMNKITGNRFAEIYAINSYLKKLKFLNDYFYKLPDENKISIN